MNLFLDNTFSPKLARALLLMGDTADVVVAHLLDRYPNDPGDLTWIADIRTWDGPWVILSGDRRIYTNPQRRALLLSSGRTTFFMPSRYPDMTRWEQAWRLVKWLPTILEAANRARTQQLYDVSESGRLTLLQRKL